MEDGAGVAVLLIVKGGGADPERKGGARRRLEERKSENKDEAVLCREKECTESLLTELVGHLECAEDGYHPRGNIHPRGGDAPDTGAGNWVSSERGGGHAVCRLLGGTSMGCRKRLHRASIISNFERMPRPLSVNSYLHE